MTLAELVRSGIPHESAQRFFDVADADHDEVGLSQSQQVCVSLAWQSKAKQKNDARFRRRSTFRSLFCWGM